MNCREAEKFIYLYAELGTGEREVIASHIDTCVACSRLLEAVKTQSEMITAASRAVPRLPDASQMTQSIMEAIHERQRNKQSVFNIMLPISPVNVLRYSMAMVSFLLIVTFVAEYNAGTKSARPYKSIPAEESTVLNSASFHAALMKMKRTRNDKRTLSYEWILNCLYPPNGDCEGCGKQIAKLN